jgi:hypothetical protein
VFFNVSGTDNDEELYVCFCWLFFCFRFVWHHNLMHGFSVISKGIKKQPFLHSLPNWLIVVIDDDDNDDDDDDDDSDALKVTMVKYTMQL